MSKSDLKKSIIFNMNILSRLPDDVKILTIEKCLLGHKILLEKHFFHSESFLNDKLKEHFPSEVFDKSGWNYKIRALVNYYKFKLPRLVFVWKEKEMTIIRSKENNRLEELVRHYEKTDHMLNDMLSVINLFSNV